MTALALRSLAFAVLASGIAFAQSDSVPANDAAKLVEEIAAKPEIYHQSCMRMERDSSLEIQVSLRGESSHSQYEVSAKQFASLRKQRSEAIKALEAWLEKGEAADSDEALTARRSKLAMLVDLNAVEALPLLKKDAERWKKIFDAAGTDTKADWSKLDSMDADKKKAILSKADSRDRLGDALSAIAAILRAEKFEPLLKSDIEKDAEASIAEGQKNGWFASIVEKIKKNDGKVSKKDQEMVWIDAILNEPVSNYLFPTTKISAETVAQILGWADEFSKVPEEKRLGEKGMTAWPVNR